MTRAYIRLDPAFDERKESYPDGPYAALIATFCLAEHQPERGRFRSIAYLRRLLGHRGRHLTFLVDHRDVVELPDGRAYVDGWDEWQEGDWKVAERVQRIRHRPKGTTPVTPPVTPGVTLHPPKAPETDRLDSGDYSGGGAEAMSAGNPPPDQPEWDAPETPVLQWLSDHGCWVQPGNGYHRNLITAVERHGAEAVIASMERMFAAGTKRGDTKAFVFKAVDLLDDASRPDPRELEAEERQEERTDDLARRIARTQVRLHENGAHMDESSPTCPRCKEAGAA